MNIIPYDSNIHIPDVIKLEEDAWLQSMNKVKYNSHQGWILKKNNKIIGVCIYKKLDLNSIYLSTFIISEKYTGFGYGKILLNLLIEFADREKFNIILKAYRGTAYLIKLYKAYGFELQIGSESKNGSPIMIRYYKYY